MSSGHGESLDQRVAEMTSRGLGATPPDAHGSVPPIKHCWYSGPHGRQAALLLEWRRVGDGYDGRVAVAVPDSSGWGLVEMWVDAALLEPG
ncbi:hypothetical protein [Nocardioides sp.]|uniref:hypothetical protein n=1 Tax=Nocardioides sp. TaxID=35761 RepID=UPI002B53FABA|nr:hypothetical protein [Nocardioides sp.]HXH78846.1 hypothetical protein [Nocardioides sp.]